MTPISRIVPFPGARPTFRVIGFPALGATSRLNPTRAFHGRVGPAGSRPNALRRLRNDNNVKGLRKAVVQQRNFFAGARVIALLIPRINWYRYLRFRLAHSVTQKQHKQFVSELQLRYPKPTSTEQQCLEWVYNALRVQASYNVAAFFSKASRTIPQRDVVRVLDICYALRHVNSRLKKHPSAILTRVSPGTRSYLESLEWNITAYNDDLVLKGDIAGVAPEHLSSLSSTLLHVLEITTRSYLSSEKFLRAELPAPEATRVSKALYQFGKTQFRYLKWQTGSTIGIKNNSGQEQRRLRNVFAREEGEFQKRVSQEGQQALRVLDTCSQTPLVEQIRRSITKAVKRVDNSL